jgi:tetratricopeptide (TPR) repeat protein
MYKILNIYSKQGEHKSVIKLSEDIEKLSHILSTDKYNDICYVKAIAYYNLKEFNDLLLIEADKAQKLFPNDIRNIDLFSNVLRRAKKTRDNIQIKLYAEKIIDLQKRHKINDYSPMVELDYINALKALKQYDKALKEDIKLLYVKLTDKQQANVLYIAGDLSIKLDKKKDAKEFFTKCGLIVEDNPWLRLCSESLKLLEE